MPSITKAVAGRLSVELFWHSRSDAATASEYWRAPCIAFTRHGSWRIRSARGDADIEPSSLLMAAGDTEYECSHPDGMDDRLLVCVFSDDVDIDGALAAPMGERTRRLRRSLNRELSSRHPESAAIDDIGLALVAVARDGDTQASHVASGHRRTLDELRRLADERALERGFDFTAAARHSGFSRTRLIHLFVEAFGLTPHEYMTARRTSRAAEMLRTTTLPLVDVCFASGFGSLPRFHAAFSAAFGVSPARYRRSVATTTH